MWGYAMNNREKLIAFFEAENNRDWEKYRQFLHPDVKWVLHSKKAHTVCGINAYVSEMNAAYSDNGTTFVCEGLYPSIAENRIVTILVNSLNERSCDIFDFKDGLIYEEHEFILA